MTSNKFKESIHQEFERYMRDEMDDNEKKNYQNTLRFKNMIKEISKVFIDNSLKKKI
tara:strand:- start:2633 stop:2803 length:171 start_codon:yes stop_codon:yes gene_type:complete